MILHVTEAVVCGPHHLRLRFSDGVTKRVDLAPLLRGPVFEPLRDPAYFARVELDEDFGAVQWPNGADFAPEALHELEDAGAVGEGGMGADHRQFSLSVAMERRLREAITRNTGGTPFFKDYIVRGILALDRGQRVEVIENHITKYMEYMSPFESYCVSTIVMALRRGATAEQVAAAFLSCLESETRLRA